MGETTLQIANHDREAIVVEEMRAKENYMRQVSDIFLEMDKDGSNTVTVEEFKGAMKDKKVLAYFNALELDFTDIMTLFVLLDRDQNGSINLEEFLRGCMRLKGAARTFDIAKLQYEAEWLMHNISFLVDEMVELSDRSKEMLNKEASSSSQVARPSRSTFRSKSRRTTLNQALKVACREPRIESKVANEFQF